MLEIIVGLFIVLLGLFIFSNIVLFLLVPLIVLLFPMLYFRFLVKNSDKHSRHELFLFSVVGGMAIFAGGYFYDSYVLYGVSACMILTWLYFSSLDEKKIVIEKGKVRKTYKNKTTTITIDHEA